MYNRRSKYNSKKTKVMGITFDSKKEANYYLYLLSLKQSGTITSIELQKSFVVASYLGKDIKYKADFFVTWSHGNTSVIDVKGFLTELYKLKRALMKEKYDIDIVEIK